MTCKLMNTGTVQNAGACSQSSIVIDMTASSRQRARTKNCTKAAITPAPLLAFLRHIAPITNTRSHITVFSDVTRQMPTAQSLMALDHRSVGHHNHDKRLLRPN